MSAEGRWPAFAVSEPLMAIAAQLSFAYARFRLVLDIGFRGLDHRDSFKRSLVDQLP